MTLPKILVTHAGSLPRPAELARLLAQHSRGEEVDKEQLRSLARQATENVVARQIQAGIDIVNDGEQQREGFFRHVRHRMSGFGGVWKRYISADILRYPSFQQREAQTKPAGAVDRNLPPKAIGEIRYVDRDSVQEDCATLRRALERHNRVDLPAFLTAPSPGIVASAMKNEFYDSQEHYMAALGEALRQEYEAIVGNGFTLQIDAPDIGLEQHKSFFGKPKTEFLAFVELVVETINRALQNIPPERARMHVCWGNYEGPHDLDIPLREILPLIQKAKVGGFFFPFANGRHAHEYRELKPLAKTGHYVVAGVIDVLTNVIEHPEAVADRLERVVSVLGDPSLVMAGTDCGFDTTAGGGRVVEEIVWAKLAALAEGARIASSRLSGSSSAR